MEYNKLNIFYLALTEKECFRLPFELSFEQFLLKAQLPAGVRENEPELKHKSPQNRYSSLRFRRWNTHLDKQTLGITKKLFWVIKEQNLQTFVLRPTYLHVQN